MGNLLKVLACAELEHGPIVFLDFERETIRFLFFWVIPFSLLPLLCFPHSIDLSWPLCHLYVLIYPFLPPQLYSSSPSLFLFWFPLQGLAFESHLASFLKGLIHTRHILLGADRCTMARWRHNKMTTIMLWSRLISYKKKPRRNKTECQSCVGFCCSGRWWWLTEVYRHPPPPHLLIPYCVTYCVSDLSVCGWVYAK